MPRLLFVLVLVLFAGAKPTKAQLFDDFSDGDYERNPPWVGTPERWAVAWIEGNAALQSKGLSEADTLYLATASSVAYGTWSFVFSHESVNLSNANGTRVYLTADGVDLTGPVQGYYLQLGMSNADEIRLYRQDGSPHDATKRVMLGRSATPLLEGDGHRLALQVSRSADDAWVVVAGADTVLTARDGTYRSSASFGLWLKHSQAAAQAFAFDDIRVQEHEQGDLEPPRLVAARYEKAYPGFLLAFNEPIDTTDAGPGNFTISNGVGAPATVTSATVEGEVPGSSLILALASPLTPGLYTIQARHISDLAGNVLADTTFAVYYADVSASPPRPGDIVVNEIQYDPPGGVPEFVELYNRSSSTFDLSAFTLADSRDAPSPAAALRTPFFPDTYVVLTRDAAALRQAYPGARALEMTTWPSLNNSGDAVVLGFDATTVDSVSFVPAWGGAGVSLERRDPGGPSASSTNWGSSQALLGGTPGDRNSLYSPDTSPPRVLFVEETAAGILDVFFDEGIAEQSLTPAQFSLRGALPQSASLLDGGHRVRLHFALPLQEGDLSAAGVADAAGNQLASTSTPVAWMPTPGDLIVNEIMYDPLADRFDLRPDQPEYVELLNRASHRISLRGLYWTDRPDEVGRADTLRGPAGWVSAAPRGYAVVYAEPAAGQPAAPSLTRAFPDVDLSAASVTLLPIPGASLGLTNTGDVIRLHRRDGALLDDVAFSPGWHAAGLLDAKGTSLERIDPARPAGEASTWTSCVAPAGGTPGALNSVAVAPDAAPAPPGLTVDPSPFSPDGDGYDDVTFIRYSLREAASLVQTRIFDANGRPVRTLEHSGLAGRTGQLVWDGRDEKGRRLRIGPYVVLLEAVAPGQGTTEAHKKVVVLARSLH